MAEEQRSGRNDGRNRRRRYFKRKGDRPQAEGDAGRERPAGGEPKRSEPNRGNRPEFRVAHEEGSFGAGSRSRNLRKRRRSRSRRGEAGVGAPVAPAERDVEYVPPQSVYVYEHLVRPSVGSYEFRSESFSKGGRTLEDYELDLSIVFSPPAREPVGQVIARVFAEFEAADALEAARSGRPVGDDSSEGATPLGSLGEARRSDEATPWTGRDPAMAATEAALEASDEAQEPPPGV